MKRQVPRGGRIINNGSISATTPRAALGAVHGDEARDHGTDEVGLARRPRLRHRLRPDRHRQRSDRHDRAVAEVGALQPDGTIEAEPTFDPVHVGEAVAYMAGLPLSANVQSLTVMATKMPFVGRG